MIKRFFLLLLLAFIISQFLRPNKNESSYASIEDFEKATVVPDHIKTILQNNCYDCHSSTTRYPWYMEVSPVSHWMAHHIKEGKEHFNVSEWNQYTPNQKDHKLEEFIEEIERKEMPLESYTWMHGKLTDQEATILTEWAKEVRAKLVNPIEASTVVANDSIVVKQNDSIEQK